MFLVIEVSVNFKIIKISSSSKIYINLVLHF